MNFLFELLREFSKYVTKENTTTTIFSIPKITLINRETLLKLVNFAKKTPNSIGVSFSFKDKTDTNVDINNVDTVLDEIYSLTDKLSEMIVKIIFTKSQFFSSVIHTYDNFFMFFNLEKALEKLYTLNTQEESVQSDQKVKLAILDLDYAINFENDFFVIQTKEENDIALFADTKYLIAESDLKKVTEKNIFFSTYSPNNNSSLQQTPYFWETPSDNTETKLKRLFDYYMLKSFFSLVSNKQIEQNKFLIRGYYNLKFTLSKNINTLNSDVLINLFDFISEDKSEDKLLILRNVLTNYLTKNSDSNSFSSQIEDINSSVRHLYGAFIKEELAIFLEQKQQIISDSVSLAKTISTNTTQITSNMKLVFFTFILTIISSTVTDIFEKVSTSGVLYILGLLFACYILISLFTLYHDKEGIDSSINSFKKSLGYIGTETIDEGLSFNKLQEDFFQTEYKIFINTYTMVYISYIFLLGLDFIILYLIFQIK